MSVDLSKGFATWKVTVHSNPQKMKEHGFRIILA